MAIPRYNELFGDVLRVLSDKKEYKTTNLKEIIANQIDLTEEERKERLDKIKQFLDDKNISNQIKNIELDNE